MKKLILILSIIPTLAFAYEMSSSNDDFDIPGTQISDEELGQVVGDAKGAVCANHSDMFCYGKKAGAVCVTEPPPPAGRSGICIPRGSADENNQVSCLCR
jgi:hypothetical protein